MQMTDKTREMPKNINYSEAEGRLYKWWEEHGWFKPEVAGQEADPFVIAIPPPNVTGELHLGHAMFVSLEDLMTANNGFAAKQPFGFPATTTPELLRSCRSRTCCARKGWTVKPSGARNFCTAPGNGKRSTAMPLSTSCG